MWEGREKHVRVMRVRLITDSKYASKDSLTINLVKFDIVGVLNLN